MSDDDKWMTIEEVMSYLGIARSTLSLYVKQNRLKRFEQQAPKRPVFLREQVEKLKTQPIPKPPKERNHS